VGAKASPTPPHHASPSNGHHHITAASAAWVAATSPGSILPSMSPSMSPSIHPPRASPSADSSGGLHAIGGSTAPTAAATAASATLVSRDVGADASVIERMDRAGASAARTQAESRLLERTEAAALRGTKQQQLADAIEGDPDDAGLTHLMAYAQRRANGAPAVGTADAAGYGAASSAEPASMPHAASPLSWLGRSLHFGQHVVDSSLATTSTYAAEAPARLTKTSPATNQLVEMVRHEVGAGQARQQQMLEALMAQVAELSRAVKASSTVKPTESTSDESVGRWPWSKRPPLEA